MRFKEFSHKAGALILAAAIAFGAPMAAYASSAGGSIKPATIEAARKNLENAKAEEAKAKETFAAAEKALNEANAAKDAAKQAASDAAKERDDAKSAEQAAQDAVDAKQAELDDVNAYLDGTKKIEDMQQYKDVQDAEDAKNKAETEMADAQAAADLAEQAMIETEAELVAQEQTVKDAEEMTLQKQSAVDEAAPIAQAAAEAKESAQASYDAAKADADTAKAAADEARAAKSAADAALASAQNAKAAAEAKAAKAVSDQADIESRLAVAKAAYDKGSFGFFESVGADDALEALKTAKYADFTKQNDPTDAVNLENMKAVFDFIRECNELRAMPEHAAGELLVTDRLMAIAQSNLNWSDTEEDHSQQFNVAENLSWGYEDPFDGWYTEEKEDYDLIRAGQQPKYSGNTGHYENIVNKDYTITGFAMDKQGRFSICHGQVFDLEPQKDEKTYTVDEYENRFLEYYNSVSTEELQKALEAAKTAKTEADAEVIKAAEDIAAAQAAIAPAEEAKTAAEQVEAQKNTVLEGAKSALDSAISDADEKADALKYAQADLEAHEAKLEAEKLHAASLKTKLEADKKTAEEKAAELEAAEKAAEEADRVYAEKKKALEDLMDGTLAKQLEKELEALQADLAKAKENAAEKEKAAEDAANAFSDAEADAAKKEKEYDDAKKALDAAIAKTAEAQAIYDDMRTIKPNPVYTVIEGGNIEWTKGCGRDVLIISNAPFDKFESVSIDGFIIDRTSYSAESGSTRITLRASYLERLVAGKHTIRIKSKDGSADTTLTIKNGTTPDNKKADGKPNNQENKTPQTGDAGMAGLWTALLLVSGAALTALRRKAS